MREHGFKVTTGYLGLPTAWRAEYTYGRGGRVVGINSGEQLISDSRTLFNEAQEMDALSGLGHACGHNLIAVSGCGVAVALKAVLEQSKTPGKIILLGTPGMRVRPLEPNCIYSLGGSRRKWRWQNTSS